MDERRHRFLLRLVCARFAHLFVTEPDRYSRVVLEGLDAFLKQLFWDTYDDLNRGIGFAFAELRDTPDQDLWAAILAQRHRYLLAVGILLHVILYFETLDRPKNAFIARVNSTVGDENRPLTGRTFDEIMTAMCADLVRHLADERARREIDVLFGSGTAGKVLAVNQAFSAPGHGVA